MFLHRWSELQVWQHGALVKHVRGLFKAEGINNSAEPGNGMHARFYVSHCRYMILKDIFVQFQDLDIIEHCSYRYR